MSLLSPGYLKDYYQFETVLDLLSKLAGSDSITERKMIMAELERRDEENERDATTI